MYCLIPSKAPGSQNPLNIMIMMKRKGMGTVNQTMIDEPWTPLKIAKKIVNHTKTAAPKA